MGDSGPILAALEDALSEMALSGQDGAAVALAREYAEALDAGVCGECAGRASVLVEVGPRLLAALTALGMTPAARSGVARGVPQDGNPAADALAKLREQHARRRGAG